jgi:cytochrome c oxidase assembly protein subunit 15
MKAYDRYSNIPSVVKWWLLLGVILIFFQIIIGGITRLTGSGLSITKWDIITGTLPPLNEADWLKEFELYRSTPQYEKINKGFSISEFKFIYFWEYFHRLWARVMGLVFLLPLVYFVIKGYINSYLRNRLVIIFSLAALVATFGWIMVASGLVERPWVNAYKLSMHLGLALVTFSYLLWTYYLVVEKKNELIRFNSILNKLSLFLIFIISFQIFTGALVSGMRAALVYPNWPYMNGEYLPSILLNAENWNLINFSAYDGSAFMPALTQFVHRNVAYLIVLIVPLFIYRSAKEYKVKDMKYLHGIFLFLIVLQVSLGIITVVSSKGQIPVFYGVAHQGVAILILALLLLYRFKMSRAN